MVFGQPVGLSKEVCLYAGADWLKLICQSEGGERSVAPLHMHIRVPVYISRQHAKYILCTEMLVSWMVPET